VDVFEKTYGTMEGNEERVCFVLSSLAGKFNQLALNITASYQM